MKRVFRNFNDVVNCNAEMFPEKSAISVLGPDGRVVSDCTFEEVRKRAQVIAGYLNDRCRKGERVLLVHSPGIDFITAFLGCFYAGNIAVPTYPPLSPDTVKKFQHIMADAEPSVLLADTFVSQFIESAYGPGSGTPLYPEGAFGGEGVVDSSTFDLSYGDSYRPHTPEKEDLAFMQYTSGSTGNPKGVMVSHGNLLHNAASLAAVLEHTQESIMMGWLPPYHDLGLVGDVLNSTFCGMSHIVMSPFDFLRDPVSWLRAITEHSATTSGGPNFAYELCVKNATEADLATLDLSSWKIAFNAAEPIRLGTLHRFADKFSSCGFDRRAIYPCYGLAECALMVSGGKALEGAKEIHLDRESLNRNHVVARPEPDPSTISFVAIGKRDSAGWVEIADPETRRRCRADEVGEIWVKGEMVTSGYWRKEALNREVFGVSLVSGEGPFFRTGDLGFIRDGDLYITGRMKDLIILNGKNYYPQDIEVAAEDAHERIRAGRCVAFSIPGETGERLCIVAEYKGESVSGVFTSMTQCVRRDCGVSPDVIVLIQPKTLPITTSGKVRRREAGKRYMDHSLEIIASFERGEQGVVEKGAGMPVPAPENVPGASVAESLLARVRGLVAGIISVEPESLDVDAPLGQYGVTSMAVAQISAELEALSGRSFSPMRVYEYPTVRKLCEALDNETCPVSSMRGGSFKESAPIAVIGLSGNFPGSDTPEEFMENLAWGRCLISGVPAGRDELSGGVHDPLVEKYMRFGGFMGGVGDFDAEFFGIPPKEAELMDPQHRKYVEAVWHAVEDAGYAPSAFAGSRTGVFSGISTFDYSELIHSAGEPPCGYTATGLSHCMLSNRVSYLLDFKGPSETIDTACSSSLLAVHRAVQALRSGECDLAVAGGVNVLLSREGFAALGRAGVLSEEGLCKTFDRSADGYVRGEGVGVVVLKPLEKAVEDNDSVYAVIRGTASGHGGRAESLTAPDENSQAEVIVQALEDAKVPPETISYVETHGTGTVLGDPIEINGLKKAFSAFPRKGGEATCALGSVKTNIGHLEAAAGIAGLIKVILSMKRGVIPATVNYQEQNPHIDLDGTPFYIAERTVGWPQPENEQGERIPRRAGVSSFGFGGAYAHVVLEEYGTGAASGGETGGEQVVVLSAKTPAALERQVGGLLDFLESDLFIGGREGVTLSQIAWTLQAGRESFSCRLALVAASLDELAEKLRAVLSGSDSVAGVFLGGGEKNVSEKILSDIRGGLEAARIAAAWAEGGEIDWHALDGGKGPRRVALPGYPFERERHWVASRRAAPPVDPGEPVEETVEVLAGYENVVAWLAEEVSFFSGLEAHEIDPGVTFEEYGLDSVALIDIHDRLGRQMGGEISSDAIRECPDIRSLALFVTEGETAELPDLVQEAVLDDSILACGENTIMTDFKGTGNTLLLTGATGFFGIFLLRELLLRTDARIFCLVRAADVNAGLERLRLTAEKFRIDDISFADRIEVVVGDLTEAYLGLDDDAYQNLARRVDTVYHCGAAVDWMKPYRVLKSSNVSGTGEVIRFAFQGRIKPLHFISSLAVLPLDRDRYEWFEDELPGPENLVGGYGQTKWVAEKMCAGARAKGLPVNIYRFDYVAGTLENGAMKETDFIVRLIKGCIEAGCMPLEETNFDIIPVDFLSRVVVGISRKHEHINKTFHLINRSPFSVSDFASLIRSFGYSVERVPFKRWKNLIEKMPESSLYPLYPFIRQYDVEKLEQYARWVVDNTNTVTALMDIDPGLIEGTPSAGEVMGKVIRHFMAKGHLPQPFRAPVLERQAAYWARTLEGLEAGIELPGGRLAEFGGEAMGYAISRLVTVDLAAKMQRLCREENLALSEVLLTAFQVLVCRYSGKGDVCSAVPVLKQLCAGGGGTEGFLAKPLVIRSGFQPGMPFRVAVSTVSQSVSEAFANMDTPSEEIMGLMQPGPAQAAPLTCETMFVYRGAGERERLSDRLDISPLEREDVGYSSPVAFQVEKQAGTLTVTLYADGNRMDESAAKMMVSGYLGLLEHMAENPGKDIFTVPVMASVELDRILSHWNATEAACPDKAVHELFSEKAKAAPEAVALCYNGSVMTYGELDLRSDQLACRLERCGAGPGTITGLFVEKSPEMVVGLLGILKAGGAYLPLDPAYPRERLAYMLEDSGAGQLLTTAAISGLLPETDIPLTFLDRDWRSIEAGYERHGSGAARREKNDPESMVYIIYTSGSTGKPKGVRLLHRGLTNLLFAMDHHLEFTPEDNFLALTTLSFDLAALEIFLPLVKGGRLELVSREIAADGFRLKAFLESSGVTFIQATPATWRMLKYSGWEGDGKITLLNGGEALSEELADTLVAWGGRAFNGYGPTETTLHSTVKRLSFGEKVTIGRPLANTLTYVLDAHMNPLPPGVAGELWLGGTGVSDGYNNRNDLTDLAFKENPFCSAGAGKIYRTGDLVRYLSNGEIDYIGRLDHQVKIRGYRIELGEVEKTIKRQEGVRECVVVAREYQKDDKRLVAYILPAENPGENLLASVRTALTDYLPAYMNPADYVVMDAFPLTPNGKIDRKALPAPSGTAAENEYVPPSTATEVMMTEIWQDALNMDGIGIHDNFIDVGGDSILAMRLLVRINREMGVNLTVQTLFSHLTIARISAEVDRIKCGGVLNRTGNAGEILIADAGREIAVDPSLPAPPPGEIRNLLFTGATGFLGAFLLKSILDKTEVTLFCLVRARSRKGAFDRVVKNMKTYSLWEERYAERIKPVPGDLSEERLGLSAETYESLAEEMDAICHNGSLVNFAFPYELLKKANVDGTREILKLAVSRRMKRFFHISTIGVFESSHFKAGRVILETDDLPDPSGLFYGYSQSKWVAEKLVQGAAEKGLPVTIFRPSTIFGDSCTGASNLHDLFCYMIKACETCGAVPDIDIDLDGTPVDHVADTIVEIAQKAESSGRVFHLANPAPVHVRQTVGYFRAGGYDMGLLPFDEWSERLAEVAESDEYLLALSAVIRNELIPGSGKTYFDIQQESLPAYSVEQTMAVLDNYAETCPPLDAAVFGRYLKFFVANNYISEATAEEEI